MRKENFQDMAVIEEKYKKIVETIKTKGDPTPETLHEIKFTEMTILHKINKELYDDLLLLLDDLSRKHGLIHIFKWIIFGKKTLFGNFVLISTLSIIAIVILDTQSQNSEKSDNQTISSTNNFSQANPSKNNYDKTKADNKNRIMTDHDYFEHTSLYEEDSRNWPCISSEDYEYIRNNECKNESDSVDLQIIEMKKEIDDYTACQMAGNLPCPSYRTIQDIAKTDTGKEHKYCWEKSLMKRQLSNDWPRCPVPQ